MTKLLVVDDESLILESVQMAFPEYEVLTCTCGERGRELFQQDQPDVVLCDIRLPDISGMELFQQLHATDSKTPIILMTGQGTAGTAIEAMQLGAYEYVLKPLDPDMLIPLVESALETSRLMRVPAHLPGDASDVAGDRIVGDCPAMQEVYRAVGALPRRMLPS